MNARAYGDRFQKGWSASAVTPRWRGALAVAPWTVACEGTFKSVRPERGGMPTFELNLSDDVYAEFQQ
ncbi:MAG: hypothetical protein ACQEUA_04695, partial [Halobacteriota archaeon]